MSIKLNKIRSVTRFLEPYKVLFILCKGRCDLECYIIVSITYV